MRTIAEIFGACSPEELDHLKSTAARTLELVRRPDREIPIPVFFEFSGSPKAGKSSIIGIVSHFLRRAGFRVGQPAEGASLRLPPDLKDDWLAFNAWTACYALTTILEDSHAGEPDEIVLLDRGLFDACAWMMYLESQEKISKSDREAVVGFLTLDLWRRRQAGVFSFTADHRTSLERETSDRLTSQVGRAMNPDVLAGLLLRYQRSREELASLFAPLVVVDTSFKDNEKPNFQRVAYEITLSLLARIEELAVQELLVVEPIKHSGLIRDENVVNSTLQSVVQSPRFMPREAAESSTAVQQIVPYAMLRNGEGKFLKLRRRTTGERKELAGKSSILLGGHAEKKDWDSVEQGDVFERCLRREVSEEMIGLHVKSLKRLGLINDVRNSVGNKHLAVLFEAEVSGTAAVRRQTADKEFGREGVSWRTPEEICGEITDLDPWSQLVASAIFGAKLPDRDSGPSLFTDR
jgi:predicted NUDIX family phosphoesterase